LASESLLRQEGIVFPADQHHWYPKLRETRKHVLTLQHDRPHRRQPAAVRYPYQSLNKHIEVAWSRLTKLATDPLREQCANGPLGAAEQAVERE
jgi:hypothetical protein